MFYAATSLTTHSEKSLNGLLSNHCIADVWLVGDSHTTQQLTSHAQFVNDVIAHPDGYTVASIGTQDSTKALTTK